MVHAGARVCGSRFHCLAIAAGFALLSGCAIQDQSPDAETEEPDPPVRSLDYSVEWIEPEPNVVIFESGYQHVVLPSGQSVSYRSDANQDAIEKIASQLSESDQSTLESNKASHKDSESPGEEPQSDPGGDDKDQTKQASKNDEGDVEERSATYQAWNKLCEGRIADMDDGDFFLVQTSEGLPEALEDECDEQQALGQLK